MDRPEPVQTGTAPEIEARVSDDALWYKDAVIYQLHVRAFFDSNSDGIGDIHGLIQRLDYVQQLGVTAIWLLPFYPSPLRDDGYDIADYHGVHPDYGTLGDFKQLIREAHRRDIRVITEFVINHTSDQHPWFEAARRAPAGSSKRNYYVWSDTDTRYAGTRIIFTDTETSNWSWDRLANAYYWHRFFSHQPDLNFDNPNVLQAVIKAMRFWLDMGVDGMRLDAIPYLCEREGTNNENLPETHAVVKQIRAEVNARYRDRMLLAEANQWPEDVRDYFGDGDECHMAYHFPLMPRMYMAIAQEDRHPIVEIMQQTPDIPDACQWATFLRNHDELTLEMVTSRERDYMYQMYAADSRARLNLGIRRRLAPLMENDLDKIKLMNSLLFSLYGSPIIYYGDELGMGDNLYLGDRNGVRTPMQWSPERNAGFSTADPQRLYSPPIMDSVYGYQAVNVEAQAREPFSLLNWTRNVLAVRQTSKAFGRGSLIFLRPANRKILAYLREYAGETIMCVANLARSAQPVELDLSSYKGLFPVELMGRTVFPPIGALPYLLTLPGHAFYWFRLATAEQVPSWHEERLPRIEVPVLVLFDGWRSFFRERVVPWRIALAEKVREQLETQALPGFMATRRWYAGKGETPRRVTLTDDAEWGENANWLLTLCRIGNETDAQTYFLPLTLAWEEDGEERLNSMQSSTIGKIRQQTQVGALADAFADEAFCRAIVNAIGARQQVRSQQGTIRFSPTQAYGAVVGDMTQPLGVNALGSQSSNTGVAFGDRLFLKGYRRLHAGVNPEAEIGRFLTEKVRFPHCVPVAGSVDYTTDDGVTLSLALLQGYVENQGDGWTYALEYLERFLEEQRAQANAPRETPGLHGVWLTLVDTLGRRTAELHRALATVTGDPAFDPEPIAPDDPAKWVERVRSEAAATMNLLARRLDGLADAARADAKRLLDRRDKLLGRISGCLERQPGGQKIRHHGDYHLGQVLLQQNDFVIIDFEGEPARPFSERRAKHSPLRDVAGMLRSFNYVARAALLSVTAERTDNIELLDEHATHWETETRRRFVTAYRDAIAGSEIYAAWDDTLALLELFQLEKAFYELRYELDNRPAWVVIVLQGIARLAGFAQ